MLLFSLAALALGGGLAVYILRRRSGPDAAPAPEQARMPAVALRGTGVRDFDIDNEGESQEALVKLCGGEFGKPHDVDCVAVLRTGASGSVRVDIDGLLVGRLSPDTASQYVRRMAELDLAGRPGQCGAVISFSEEHACYQVRLDLQWPPTPKAADGGAATSA